MTRKSKREVERALEDLGSDGGGDVHEWVENCLDEQLTDGWETQFVVRDDSGDIVEESDHEGRVCVMETTGPAGAEFWIGEDAVPDWVDVDEDLPVRA